MEMTSLIVKGVVFGKFKKELYKIDKKLETFFISNLSLLKDLLSINKNIPAAVKIRNKIISNIFFSIEIDAPKKANGTIDFINGQRGFLSKSIYNVLPKVKDLLIFPNYLMHTAYPFNIEGERRSFSFNVKIIYKK